jgi:two-component system, NarL family, nitrate/nitrite response regulator NarL
VAAQSSSLRLKKLPLRRRRAGGPDPAPQQQAEGQAALTARVFIASNVRLYREALAEILAREEGIDVVGTAGDRLGILAQVDEIKPDVVLMDPAVAESIETIRDLVESAAGIQVIALALSETEREVIGCAEAGVSGFVTCDESLFTLVSTIRGATQGDLVCTPRTAGTLLRRVAALAARQTPNPLEPQLTARELEVVRLVDEGLSNKQIALRLQIELPTVKHHVHHILEKLGVARRSEAVARLRQNGLLQAVSALGLVSEGLLT